MDPSSQAPVGRALLNSGLPRRQRPRKDSQAPRRYGPRAWVAWVATLPNDDAGAEHTRTRPRLINRGTAILVLLFAAVAFLGTVAAVDQLYQGAIGWVFLAGLFSTLLGALALDRAAPPPKGGRPIQTSLIVVGLVFMPLGAALAFLENRPCPPPTEISVLTSAGGTQAAARALESYAQAQAAADFNQCRTVSAAVFTTGLGAAEDRALIAEGWSGEALAYGPRPDLWIPDSSADVALARQARGGDGLIGETVSAWYTPVVVGIPAEGRPESRTASLADIYGELAESTVAGARARPEDSTAAAHAAHALHTGPYGPPEEVEALMTAYPVTGAHDVGLTCAVRRQLETAEEGPHPVPAVITTERALMDLTQGSRLGTECPAENVPQIRYDAVYLDAVPGLDHPVAPLGWDAGEPSPEAADFLTWLEEHRHGEELDLHEGYRDIGGNASAVLRQTPGLSPDPLPRQVLRDGAASDLPDVFHAADQALRPARTLLLVDVSDSMQWPLANRQPAFDLATEQTAELVDALDDTGVPGDQIGLWTFPASEDFDDTEVREQVPIMPVEDAAPETRETLEHLEADLESTPLNDAVAQAVLHLDEMHEPGPDAAAHTVLVFTEGIVGSGPGEAGSTVDEVAELAGAALDDRVQVELVMLESAHCATGEPGGDLARLDGITCTPVDLNAPGALARELAAQVRNR